MLYSTVAPNLAAPIAGRLLETSHMVPFCRLPGHAAITTKRSGSGKIDGRIAVAEENIDHFSFRGPREIRYCQGRDIVRFPVSTGRNSRGRD